MSEPLKVRAVDLHFSVSRDHGIGELSGKYLLSVSQFHLQETSPVPWKQLFLMNREKDLSLEFEIEELMEQAVETTP